MNEPGKSDKSVVPPKSAKLNYWDFRQEIIERTEGRGLAKENGEALPSPEGDVQDIVLFAEPAKQVDRTQSRLGKGDSFSEDLHSALDRIRQAACRDKGLKFTALWHHVYDIERLREAYLALKRDASAGIDGQTWQAYGQELEKNLRNLSDRLARGVYRAKPVKRVYIPKADGKKRPIGIPVLASFSSGTGRATVKVLNAVYETDFLGFSYGFRQFDLELHAEKTRVIEFGRFASERRARRGQGKPETFNFLGFTHMCDKTRKGSRFIVLRRTIAKRLHAKLKSLNQTLRKDMHRPVREVGQWLAQVLRGHYQFYGVPRNYAALDRFRDRVRRLWQRAMSRRSQKGNITEARMTRLARCWLPKPCICHPYPEARLAVIIQGKSPVR
jgi:hypothetical protein